MFLDKLTESKAAAAAYSTAAGGITGFSITEWGVVIGIVVGVFSLIPVYFAWTREMREREKHAAEMEEIRNRNASDRRKNDVPVKNDRRASHE